MPYSYPKILPFFLFHAIIYIFFTCYLYADCPPGFNEPKNQYFKILVCGDNNVASNKLEHAATVLKDIIDFDGDGMADSPEVAKRLYSSGATYIVLSSELYEEKYVNFSKNMNFTVVYFDENGLQTSTNAAANPVNTSKQKLKAPKLIGLLATAIRQQKLVFL